MLIGHRRGKNPTIHVERQQENLRPIAELPLKLERGSSDIAENA